MKNKKIKLLIIIGITLFIILIGIVIGVKLYNKMEKKERNLIFEVYSSKLNCNTVRLYVYDDNTYEFYDTYSSIEEKVEPKKGNYTYDISNLLNNINKYEKINTGPYILTNKDNKAYEIYDNNEELKDFLNSIDIDLDVCAKAVY